MDELELAGRVTELEQALFAFVMWIHRATECGIGGVHEPECTSLFEQLGWENYEEYLGAMEDRDRKPT